MSIASIIQQEMRHKLAASLGNNGPITFEAIGNVHQQTGAYYAKLISKIPRKNYADLGRLVPISWL